MPLPRSSLPRSKPQRVTAGAGLRNGACLLLGVLLSACAPQPARDSQPLAPAALPAVAPEAAAMAADDWAAVHAARATIATAASADAAPRAWLAAAEAALIGHDPVSVQAALASLPVTLEPSLEAWRVSLREVLDERAVDLDLAPERLAALPEEASDFFRLHWADAARAAGQPLVALLAASGVRADRVGPSAAAEAAGIAWASARRSLEAPPEDAPIARGWWALAEVLRNPGVSPLVTLDAWALQWPEHPAQALRASVEAELHALLVPPRRIALILPLGGGAFAEAAEAVRDGVLAAWLEDAANPERPAVVVYSTEEAGLDAACARAAEEGADLILGPLAREQVQALLDGRELLLPTLALNVVPAGERPATADPGNRLLQFGLLPEHEAAAAAEYAARQGWRPAALILPEGPWGERLREAFVTRYEASGGGPVEIARYRGGDDYQSVVRALLGASDGAAATGDGLPGFVFLAGRSDDVRQLVPYLRYFGAGHLPRATTSLAWTGQAAPDADLDLDGTLVTELPWYLGEGGLASPVTLESARAVWSARGAQAWRLFAFGLDAYRLAGRYGDLKLGRVSVLEGATGQLSLDSYGVVRNRPSWAVFRRGRPEPLLGSGTP